LNGGGSTTASFINSPIFVCSYSADEILVCNGGKQGKSFMGCSSFNLLNFSFLFSPLSHLPGDALHLPPRRSSGGAGALLGFLRGDSPVCFSGRGEKKKRKKEREGCLACFFPT
jgi:hypothetical protein